MQFQLGTFFMFVRNYFVSVQLTNLLYFFYSKKQEKSQNFRDRTKYCNKLVQTFHSAKEKTNTQK